MVYVDTKLPCVDSADKVNRCHPKERALDLRLRMRC